jgi:hypothetical protein
VGKLYGLDLPEGSKLVTFERWTSARGLGYTLEKFGLKFSGRHTQALKHGRFVIFRHKARELRGPAKWFIVWIP